MNEPSATWIIEYDVSFEDGWWIARRIAAITRAQLLNGVRREVRAPTFEDLKRECVAQRVRASWHAR